jgi:hypothetical protein
LAPFTLLALATGALALLTARDVSATQELAALTRADQAMRDRPIVVAMSCVWSSSESELFVRLANVGLGPAIYVYVTAEYGDHEYQLDIGYKIHAVLAPNKRAETELTVAFPTKPGGEVDFRQFRPLGTYQDRSLRSTYNIIWAGEAERWEPVVDRPS